MTLHFFWRWKTKSWTQPWGGWGDLEFGSNPARFRSLMIPSIVEKLGHVAGVAVLYGQGRLLVADAAAAGPDLLLAVLFIVAFATTRKFVLAGSSSEPTGR